jgi:hypothetical protein
MAAAKKPSKPWRVESPDGTIADYRSQAAAYEAVKTITDAGGKARVWHWDRSQWGMYEAVGPGGRDVAW